MSGTAKFPSLLFVYGTLMKGFHEEWQREAGAEFVTRGTIKANLYDLGDYPGARQFIADRGGRVSGELYRLRDSASALRMLDQYEEFFPRAPRRSLFIRKPVSVTLEDGRKKQAWAYLYNRPVAQARPIPRGRYGESVAALRSSTSVGSHTP